MKRERENFDICHLNFYDSTYNIDILIYNTISAEYVVAGTYMRRRQF